MTVGVRPSQPWPQTQLLAPAPLSEAICETPPPTTSKSAPAPAPHSTTTSETPPLETPPLAPRSTPQEVAPHDFKCSESHHVNTGFQKHSLSGYEIISDAPWYHLDFT